jgi:asparagine synthase (glutamine-hydrolysing)
MTAEAAENIDLRSVACEGVSPIAAIRQGLAIFGVPVHAAGSMFWLNGLCAQARAHDCGVLLTGQLGNMGISWTGDPLSQPLAYQLRRLGAGGLIKARLRRVLPRRLRAARARARLDPDWYRSSAVHPDFVRRLNLAELRLQDRNAYLSSPRERRLAVLDPGRSVGAIFAAQGAHFGLDIRDPTGDARLLSFALSVPDWVFTDPETGSDRWLIRESMRDRLPDEVRLNRRRGRQAGDLVPRLRRCTPEVESALDELAAGAATAYLDVEYMRQVWSVVQRDDTPDALRKAVTVLTRGIMGGLYVNALSRGTLS